MKHTSDPVSKARILLILSMFIYGTIGLVVRSVTLSSAAIAMLRGCIGFLFLLLICFLRRKFPDMKQVRANLVLLLLTGAMIGLNWILLFESYRYTTVAVSTLCYYMQPVFVTLAAPLLLHEKLTVRKLLCVLAALIGMSFVSGFWSQGNTGGQQMTGILLGLGAAVLYAGVIIGNKKMSAIDPIAQTMIQLLGAAVVVTPYALPGLIRDLPQTGMTSWILVGIAGIVHTGIAYLMYFSAISQLPAQSTAILSYIDPVVAVGISALILREPLGIPGIIGAVLILGAALFSELPLPPRHSSPKSSTTRIS